MGFSPGDLLRRVFPAPKKDAATAKDRVGSIGIYGLSKSGKTVYLAMLHREAAHNSANAARFRLTAKDSTLTEMLRTKELLEGRSELGRPAFPPSTTATKYYTFDAFINRRHRYVFNTMDYKGEGLDWRRPEAGDETVAFLNKCSCLLFLYEPDREMLDLSSESVDPNEPERLNRLMMFNAMLASMRKDRDLRLDMPVALVITKADLLDGFEQLKEKDTTLLGNDLLYAKFADSETFIRKVLDQDHVKSNPPWARQLHKVLSALTIFWNEVLDQAPAFQVFFVSSTGGVDTIPNERGDKEVVPPARLRPKGVLNPAYWVVDMVTTMQRTRTLNRIIWRWLLPLTLVLQIGLGYLNYQFIGREYHKQAEGFSRSAASIDRVHILQSPPWIYWLFYHPLYARHETLKTAVTLRNDLKVLAGYAGSAQLPIKAPKPDKTVQFLTQDINNLLAEHGNELGDDAERIREFLRSLDDRMKDRIFSTITVSAQDWKAEAVNPTLDLLVASYGPPSAQGDEELKAAMKTAYDDAIASQNQMSVAAQWQAINQLVQRTNATDRYTLGPKLEQFIPRAEGVQRDLAQRWLGALAKDPISLEEARLLGPIFEAIWTAKQAAQPPPGAVGGSRLEDGNARPAGPPGAPVASDLELAGLIRFLDDSLVHPSVYYGAGSQRAERYLAKAKDTPPGLTRTEPRAVERWVAAVQAWRDSGLDIPIRVVDAGIYRYYYEVIGVGNGAQFRGPYAPGNVATVRWKLESPPGGAGNLRLFFSPSNRRPEASECDRILRSAATVRVGVAELLEHKPVLVGSPARSMTIEVVDLLLLPRLDAGKG